MQRMLPGTSHCGATRSESLVSILLIGRTFVEFNFYVFNFTRPMQESGTKDYTYFILHQQLRLTLHITQGTLSDAGKVTFKFVPSRVSTMSPAYLSCLYTQSRATPLFLCVGEYLVRATPHFV